MKEKTIRIYCDVCESHRDICPTNITIVHNMTWDTYTYTYFCVMCGSRQVHTFDTGWIEKMLAMGSNYKAFEMPHLSYHTGGPTINHDDVDKFIESLNAHDHLAAYA